MARDDSFTKRSMTTATSRLSPHAADQAAVAAKRDESLPWSDPRVAALLGVSANGPVTSRGLVFAMDATASRQPSWDRAIEQQAAMFTAFTAGLKVQFVYYRGGEFQASVWSRRPDEIARQMRTVTCRAGITRIERVLRHVLSQESQVAALVFVGDCMEENAEVLAGLARKLGERGIPIFIFQDGGDSAACATFPRLADLSNGAYCRLGATSSNDLKELLAAVAAYAAQGRDGLARLATQRPAARLLLTQLK